MCDIHLELFRKSIREKFDLEGIPSGHPLNTLYRENEKIIKDVELLGLRASRLTKVEDEPHIFSIWMFMKVSNMWEFWIQAGEKFIYIIFFPVRDENGEYLGTVEVTQDVTDIRKLKGEERILD